ncbi:RidA family protein [Acidisoma sp. L85]|uniref:RidA family protein n=1 Tax=Acidisoma sp. L85 TaxID=1641850 RepID=UPI00131BD0D1|nr:Rid family hydrolase [Acidisoma sp. L85]
MPHKIHDAGIARHIGSYSDAIEVAPHQRWLMTSGTPGLSEIGRYPDDITGQSELAWRNIILLLNKAAMAVEDIVKVTQYLTRAEDISAYAQVRNRFLGHAKPASMLLLTPQLVWSGLLVEVEIIASKA